MSSDTLMGICSEEVDRYVSMYVFIQDVSDELAKGEHLLVHPVFYNINCNIWALCDLKDDIKDLKDRDLHDVSTLIDNSRSKIINLLNELTDKVSKPTTKQKIKDYALKFEKESISAVKLHKDLETKLLLSYYRRYHLNYVDDDVPLNKNTSNLISKRSDVDIPSENTGLFSFLIAGSGSHKSPTEEQGKYKQEEAKQDNGMPYQGRVPINV